MRKPFTDKPSLAQLIDNNRVALIRSSKGGEAVQVFELDGTTHNFETRTGIILNTTNESFVEITPGVLIVRDMQYFVETREAERLGQPSSTVLSWEFNSSKKFDMREVDVGKTTPTAILATARRLNVMDKSGEPQIKLRPHPNSEPMCREDMRLGYIGPRFDGSNLG